MNWYESLVRSWLFRMEAEQAHERVVSALERLQNFSWVPEILEAFFGSRGTGSAVEVSGIRFPNPVGLAAGFDKDARLLKILPRFGFGFIEAGTLTPRPQSGNPAPRLFRIPESEALLNRLGFNNGGAEEAARRLEKALPLKIPLGINVGKNADTPLEQSAQDYRECLRILYPFGDFFVLNISSPNTEELRRLHERDRLLRVLDAVESVRRNAGKLKPLFLKISPDLSPQELSPVVEIALERSLGIVATNTTVSRPGLSAMWSGMPGGLSGRPLREISTRTLRWMHAKTQGRVPLIGVGGIFSAQDAEEKLRAGARLVEVYTGWIYRGPLFIRGILKEMRSGKKSPPPEPGERRN